MKRLSRKWIALPVALAASSAIQCATLGRLFSSPEQRAQLDALRTNQAGAPTGGPPVGANVQPMPPFTAPPRAAAPPPEPTALNGIVRRSSGKNTVWLNQTPQDDSPNLRPGRSTLSLRLPSGQEVILSPGQRYDPSTGRVEEAHEP